MNSILLKSLFTGDVRGYPGFKMKCVMTFTDPSNRKLRVVVILEGVPAHVEALEDHAKEYFNAEEWELS